MKVPKYIKKKLIQRAQCAERFLELDGDIVEWLEKKGFNTLDDALECHILTGAESLCNPWSSVKAILEYIEGDGLREGERFEKNDKI